MLPARPSRMKRFLAGLFSATALCVLAGSIPVAQAQDAERPLGMLFPGIQQAPPQVRSPIPPIQTRTVRTTPSAATKLPNTSTAPASRPLGTLFNPASSAPQGGGSVLPKNWQPQATAQPAQVSQPTNARVKSSDRPLGVLIDLPAPRQSPASAAARTQSVQAREIQPAARVLGQPGIDASGSKPLGTLFGTPPDTDVQPQTNVKTAQTAPEGAASGSVSNGGTDNLVPAKLSADSMTFDRDLGLIIATGNVEIEYGGRSLLADKVTYNQKTDVVLADGNVSMSDLTGKVLFGDKIEITGDLKDGVIYNIGLVLEDKSRIAGTGARRSNGTITETNNAVYSPCNLCAEDPSAAPLWQLKAVKVVHDSEKKQVTYRNAWLEMFGIPVAYTPYLSHPDPTVKRRSGFLAPSIENSSDLGSRVFIPYFWAIDDYQDATLTPMLSTDGGQGAIAQYRRNFKHGLIEMNGSFVGDDPDRGTRGYIDFESEYHLNKTWRAGLNVETASDDTYTRRYGFTTEPVLESRAYLEGFRSQNYQVLNAYSFKDLRQETDLEESPLVIPMYDFNYNGKRDKLGGFAAFDFNALNLYRETGTDTRRMAFRPRWDRPFNGPFGELYNASVSLAADAYHATNVIREDGTSFTGSSGRVVPRAALSWRLPLIRPGENYSQTIEPLASLVAAPNGGDSDKIPNEDSQELEFDETNLFQDNRYDGFDRVDRGIRLNYGVNWVLTGNKNGSSSVFLGQSYRPIADTTFTNKVGVEEKFSDYVGRIQITPHKYLNLLYRTQFSPDNFTPQRNEITSTIGSPALRLNTNYIFIDQQQGSEFSGREEINGSISSQINQNWSTSFSARRDMSASEMRSLGLRLVYEDECVKFTTQLSRSFFEDRDLQPSDSITFTLLLKTLGEVHTGAFISQ